MIRKDIYKIDIQDNLYFLVFHKIYNGDFGPAVSLVIYNNEFLKFDCLGKNKGHYHIYVNNQIETIYFTEKSSLEQIDRSVYELRNNINNFLKKHDRDDIQNFEIDMNTFLNKIDEVKSKLLEYEHTHYSLLR